MRRFAGKNSIMAICVASMATALSFFAQSCSTTRVLQDGEYRLAKNEVLIENDKRFSTNKVEPYIKQKPNSNLIFGWNPFLNVYNWGGKSNSFFARLFRKIGTPPVVYEPDKVNASEDNIKRHLEYLGYYGSVVGSEVNVKRKNVKVTYKVTLGKRFPIKDIHYNVPSGGTFASDFLRDTGRVLVRRGDWLSEEMLENESQRSSAKMRNLGYYGFSKSHYFFQADTLTDPGNAILEYRINEYTRNESEKDATPIRKFTFNDVVISHPETFKIREKVLRDLNTIRPGDLYSENLVNNTYTRLSSLSVLSSVNVDVRQIDTALVNADIYLSGARLQGTKVNIEASSNSSGLFGISPGLSYYHRNIFRGGEVLNLNFSGNFQFKPNSDMRSTEFSVSAGVKIPRFVFVPVHKFRKAVPYTEIKASYNYQDRPEYKRNIISYSFGYTGSYKKLYFQFYPTQLNIVRMFKIDPTFFNNVMMNSIVRSAYTDHFDFGAGGTLYYTTSTDVNPKNSYHYFKFQFNEAGNVLSLFNPVIRKDSKTGEHQIWGTSYSQYVRGEFTAGKTWVFGKNGKQAIATRFLAGAGLPYGNSSSMPFEQQFYSGGANSLRGWQARTIGPGTSARDTVFVIPNQTGDVKLEANLEYRFGLFWKFNGAVFADAGNVWYLKDNGLTSYDQGKINARNLLEGIAIDWGLGLRLDLNFILVRLDMGMVVRNPSKEPEQRWVGPGGWFRRDGFAVHFGVGYPF